MNKNIQEIEKEISSINPNFTAKTLDLIYEYVTLKQTQQQNEFVQSLSENKDLQKQLNELILKNK